MNKRIVLTASTFGLIAVVLGAFGAHSLKAQIDSNALEIWGKGVDYQFYHVFALLFLSVVPGSRFRYVNLAYWFFTLGIVFFSGSLYLLATRDILHISFVNYIGPVTPLGGLMFILGWTTVLMSALKDKDGK
jgi:uncharacterized membrane protein YgdD (TMEM256/DUF423 family)